MNGKWAVAACERWVLVYLSAFMVVDSGKLQTSWLKSGPQWMGKRYDMWWFIVLLKERGPHSSALDSCPGDILQVDSIFAWWVGHMEAQHLLLPQSNASSSHFLAIYRHYLNSWSSESRKLISAPVTQDFPGTNRGLWGNTFMHLGSLILSGSFLISFNRTSSTGEEKLP